MTHASPSQGPRKDWSGAAGTAAGQAANTSNAWEWLTSVRKLDPVLLTGMGVRTKGDDMAFPYLKDGARYADKFRSIGKRFWSTGGVSRGLYNADALRKFPEQPVVITEGEIDCLTVIQAGFLRAVSLPDGWTAQGNKTEALVDALPDLLASPFVIVAGDNDDAGESLPRAVANLLAGHDVRYSEWPKGCKDANDVLQVHGEGEVAACLNAAKRIDPPGGFITAISDLPPLSRRRVLRAGDALLDQRIAFELGALSVGTGTPGAGKSTFTTYAAELISRNENIRVGMLGFETHPHRTRDHLARLNTGRPWDSLSGDQQEHLAAQLDERWRIVHRTFEDARGHTLGWLKTMVHTLATRDGCKLIIIDPWNELEHLPEQGESMTSYINFALQQLRQWAETLEVHICLIAHPKKMEHGRGAPLGYDVADSAAFFNKPSLGFTVHNAKTEAGTPYLELVTWKVRDTQLYGVFKGISAATFDTNAMTYTHQPDLE